ncbi:MAG: hypothetical protein QGG84_01185 [Rhodospirillales bacterium]|jgi:hypothetical protein|nr:hypothetical protein [Rhodospirillales bacterium]|tara:strand:- start:303 stop:557 length:255 start_codon:yes stop_codon:yes gene_type:complete
MNAKSDNQQEGHFEAAPPDPDSDMSGNQDSALRMLASNIHRLNESIVKAADAGLTVELMRASRYHAATAGCWGDQMVPIITRKD